MAYNVIRPFKPYKALTTVIAATTSSSATALPMSGTANQYRIYNSGAVIVYFDFAPDGTSAVGKTGTTSGTPLAAGVAEVFSTPLNATFLNVLTDSSTANVFVSPGEGN